jgi:hypothetical protein
LFDNCWIIVSAHSKTVSTHFSAHYSVLKSFFSVDWDDWVQKSFHHTTLKTHFLHWKTHWKNFFDENFFKCVFQWKRCAKKSLPCILSLKFSFNKSRPCKWAEFLISRSINIYMFLDDNLFLNNHDILLHYRSQKNLILYD